MRRCFLIAFLLLAFVPPASAQYERRGEALRVVAGWYERFLGRELDPGADLWVQALRRGEEPEKLLAAILGSDEYYTRSGRTPDGFVRQLYVDVARRRPTPREMRFWAGRATSRPREDVAYDILMREGRDWRRDDRESWREMYDYRRPRAPYR